MSILVIGATGTLGRQIVQQILKSGYPVSCLVRNIPKSNFLKEWGSTLVYGDLGLPETLPNALKGIKIIIDASTFRGNENFFSLQQVDLVGKIALIKAAEIAKIEKFIFFSIMDNDNFQSIFFMKLKKKIESILEKSKIAYTIFQISGFYQGLITQYALPILEQENILIIKDSASFAYVDTRDIAKICTKILISENFVKMTNKKILKLNGPKKWNSKSIIELCENISGQKAKTFFIPLTLFNTIKNILSLSKWSWNIQDRLSFNEFLIKKDQNYNEKIYSANNILEIEEKNMIFLESYFEDYFEILFSQLTNLNYKDNKNSKRKDLIF
jgi:uncharacterized protein YbjT (DUF2867 family)